MLHIKRFVLLPIALVIAMAFSACAGIGAFGDNINRAFNGVSATMTTYTQGGIQVDRVKGASFRVARDTRFDTSDSEGASKKDSSVLLISLGDSHISHVGSSMILAQDGLTDVSMEQAAPGVTFENTQRGTPWLNDLIEYNRNLWQGKGKTVLVRSQDGTPVAVYAGNEVEILSTDVPKSTWFRIDGKYLFVYRSDYTVYDNALLK